jgi:serine/threonine protein kinase
MLTPEGDPLAWVEARLSGSSPAELLGDSAEKIEENYRTLARIYHPDRNGGSERAAALFRKLTAFREKALSPHPPIVSPQRPYALGRLLAVGDASEAHAAGSGSDLYLLKISRIPAGNALLLNEHKVLAELRKQGHGVHLSHLPDPVESFMVRDKGVDRRINAFKYAPCGHTLEAVRAKHDPLDPRNLAWMFNRLLAVLGYVHRKGFVHGAVVPPHVLVFPHDHNARLLGWGHSVKAGGVMTSAPAAYLDWYPPEVRGKKPAGPGTDIYLAAACMSYLSGGDPTRRTFGPDLPPPMARFFGSCLLPGLRMRPDDAWALFDEFSELLRRLFGPPKFATLAM